MTSKSAPFEAPQKHRAQDAVRSGTTQLIHAIGEALGDANQPVVVDRRGRGTTFDALLRLVDAALEETQQ